MRGALFGREHELHVSLHVEILVHDNDQPAIVLTQLDPVTLAADTQTLVLEGNATTGIVDFYSVQLEIQPTASVTMWLANDSIRGPAAPAGGSSPVSAMAAAPSPKRLFTTAVRMVESST